MPTAPARIVDHLAWLARSLRSTAKGSLITAMMIVQGVSAASEPADLSALMSLLGRVERVEADYTEVVTSDLIATALSQRGQLVYEAPHHLKRISDGGDGFILDGQRMHLVKDHRIAREMDVADVPPLRAMVGALTAIFAGDLDRLRKRHRLDYRPNRGYWELDLRPTGPELRGVIDRLNLIGTGATITQIETTESTGDVRTLRMTLKHRQPPLLE